MYRPTYSTKGYDTIRAFSQIVPRLSGHDSIKLCNNTILHIEEYDPKGKISCVAVKLHDTDILKFYPGQIVVNWSEFPTKTTFARINKYAPVHFHRQKDNLVMTHIVTGVEIGRIPFDWQQVVITYDGMY